MCLQVREKLGSLRFQPAFVEVEKTFHRVSPSQSFVARGKLCISMAHGMHDYVGWCERVFNTLQGGIAAWKKDGLPVEK